LPYRNGSRPTPCDVLFTSGVDLVYLPNGRAGGSLDTLNSFAADTNVFINLISEPCREVARKAVCYFYYPPCGNVTTFEPPKSLCRDECAYVVNTVCPFEWHLASQHFAGIQGLLNRFDLHFINCSNPATYIEPLPHCCLDGLVQIGEFLLQHTASYNVSILLVVVFPGQCSLFVMICLTQLYRYTDATCNCYVIQCMVCSDALNIWS